MKKAQSATEYIMTYGWAILAITIVGALLYTQVFSNKACASGINGFDMTYPLVPVGTQYYINGADGLVVIGVENRCDRNITITAINGIALNGGNVVVAEGRQGAINATVPSLVGISGKCYSKEIRIYYNTNLVSGVQSTGVLNGRYS
ncbi:MAG: hypothetical protein KAI53_03290 [Candidatus Aenigmarchaeota archaeon]|nr:hypothetical protein [Candidatus Aenigmarchaeota archaeon]